MHNLLSPTHSQTHLQLHLPTQLGFINAVACVIMLDQVDTVLGIPKFDVQDFFSDKLGEIYGHIKTPNWITVLVGKILSLSLSLSLTFKY